MNLFRIVSNRSNLFSPCSMQSKEISGFLVIGLQTAQQKLHSPKHLSTSSASSVTIFSVTVPFSFENQRYFSAIHSICFREGISPSRNQKKGVVYLVQLIELQLMKLAMSQATQLYLAYSKSIRQISFEVTMMLRLFTSLWHSLTILLLDLGRSIFLRVWSLSCWKQEVILSTTTCSSGENFLELMPFVALSMNYLLKIQLAKTGLFLIASNLIWWNWDSFSITFRISQGFCSYWLVGWVKLGISSSILYDSSAQQHWGPISLSLAWMRIWFQYYLPISPSTCENRLKIRDWFCLERSLTRQVILVNPESLSNLMLLSSRVAHSGILSFKTPFSWTCVTVSASLLIGQSICANYLLLLNGIIYYLYRRNCTFQILLKGWELYWGRGDGWGDKVVGAGRWIRVGKGRGWGHGEGTEGTGRFISVTQSLRDQCDQVIDEEGWS